MTKWYINSTKMAKSPYDHIGLVDWGVLLAFNNDIDHTYLSLFTVGEN